MARVVIQELRVPADKLRETVETLLNPESVITPQVTAIMGINASRFEMNETGQIDVLEYQILFSRHNLH